jgi:hypothetical protein
LNRVWKYHFRVKAAESTLTAWNRARRWCQPSAMSSFGRNGIERSRHPGLTRIQRRASTVRRLSDLKHEIRKRKFEKYGLCEVLLN